MLSDESLEALGVKYRATGGVGTLAWKGHQLVFRHPTIDEWDAFVRNKASDLGGGPGRQISQLLLVAFDGEQNVALARQAYGAFLASGNAGFPNAPEMNVLLSTLAGTVLEEDMATMGKAAQLWTGAPRATPEGSLNGSGGAGGVGTATTPGSSPMTVALPPS